MNTLHTPVGNFITTAAVADAVLEYWLLLARSDGYDVVDIPTRDADGHHRTMRLTLTPSQTLAVTRWGTSTHPVRDEPAMADLTTKIAAFHTPDPATFIEWDPSSALFDEI